MKILTLENARVITNDADARDFLLAENALSGLVPEPPYDTISGFWRSANTQAYIYATNSYVPGDTGYVVVIFPFEHYSHEEAALIMSCLNAENNLRPGHDKTYTHDMEQTSN